MKKGIILVISFLVLFGLVQVQPAKALVSNICMQAVSDTKEDAIIAANNVFNTAVQAALQARKAAFNNAWSIEGIPQRRAALKIVWKNWSIAYGNAQKTYANSKKAAWDAYKTSAKSCKLVLRQGEGNEGDDN